MVEMSSKGNIVKCMFWTAWSILTLIELIDVINGLAWFAFENIKERPHLPVDFPPWYLVFGSDVRNEFVNIKRSINFMWFVNRFRTFQILILFYLPAGKQFITMLAFQQEVIIIIVDISQFGFIEFALKSSE